MAADVSFVFRSVCAQLTPLVLREYDHLITVDKIENESEEAWEECINRNTQFDTEALGDPNLRALKEGMLCLFCFSFDSYLAKARVYTP